ncbi:MarR family winged helix-turn-helix transcriptional regulator [Streptomyces sp. cmx-4-9]|uniref:MarR family winged helix-turn-helix transcriptional regulator n=1 Tax=Streptomyces sp. cmx-4-9 TaxID=2790941 RepID=UPI00397EE4E6
MQTEAEAASDAESDTHADAVSAIAAQWKRERPELDTAPLLVIGRLFRLVDALDQRLRPPFRAAGLGAGDFDVLAALRRSGAPYALSAGELSRTVLVTTGAITKRVDRLSARGLVTRSVDASDSRGRLVALTDEGVALTDELIAVHLDNQRRLLSGLSTEEQTHLAALLTQLGSTLPPGDH